MNHAKELRRMYCPHCPMGLRCVVDGGARIGVSFSYTQVELGYLQICCETVLRGDEYGVDKVIFYVPGHLVDDAYQGEPDVCLEA